MLLSPRPFGSRSGGRLEVIRLELRPPLEAIHSVRDTAQPFSAHGFPPLCFHPITYWVSVSIRMTTFQSKSVHKGFVHLTIRGRLYCSLGRAASVLMLCGLI
jgi:hypothetical protein